MVKYTIEEIEAAMTNPNNIRNVTIAAHIDLGKSSTSDSLLCKAGLISEEDAGEKRATDTRPDEQTRCITIKSTGVTMLYDLQKELGLPKEANSKYILNLIDSPGHVDFSSEVTAALRVTDGCMVILDSINGVCIQTETVLRQVLDEMVRPVALVNKLDRLILELQIDPEEFYQTIYRHVISLNATIAKYNRKMPEISINPEEGTLCFGSALQGWGFNLNTFARKWAAKLETTPEALVTKLWGENYYHPREKKWYDHKVPGSLHGFVEFCAKPIYDVIKTIMGGDRPTTEKLLNRMNIKITENDWLKENKKRIKPIMQKAFPFADALLEMIVKHLPSPVEAQRYRVDNLYSGPKGDACYNAIRDCDPNGPLVMYISKLFPAPDLSRFYAYGRVFSGTIKPDMVNIQRPEFVPGSKEGLSNVRVQQVNVMMGAKAASVEKVSAGNTAALTGVDNFIVKTATITNTPMSHNIVDMNFTVSPVVSVAVECKNGADIAALIKGLKLLVKSDPLCQYTCDKKTNQIVISGAGELHLEICVQDLREMFAKGVEIIVSDPVVPFRETITAPTSQVCLAKSPNNLNRLFMTAEPITEEMLTAIQNGSLLEIKDPKERIKQLCTLGWQKDEASRIWAYSEGDNTNVLMDRTKGAQYLSEIKDNLTNGFHQSCARGVLCDEPLIGARFNVEDVSIHSDAVHRGSAQITPAAKKAMYACQLLAQPRLKEPIYRISVHCPQEMISKIYNVLSRRRGRVESEYIDPKSGSSTVDGFLPVMESIGFTQFLRSETQGKAFPQCTFSHWEIIDEDPLQEGSRAWQIVRDVRKRKKMDSIDVPPLARFLDRL